MSTRPPSVTRTDTLFPVTTRFRSGNAGLGQLDPGQAQHLGRAVDAERAVGGGAEQLDHTAGAGADVDEPADRPVSESAGDRRLDLALGDVERSEEHTSELQSLMRISYAVFCSKKQKHTSTTT